MLYGVLKEDDFESWVTWHPTLREAIKDYMEAKKSLPWVTLPGVWCIILYTELLRGLTTPLFYYLYTTI